MGTLVDSLRDSLKEKLNSGASVLVRTTDSFRARIEQWRGASSVSQAPAPQQEPPSIITLQLGVRAVPSMESRLRSDLWLTACMRRDSAGDMVGVRMIERFTALASQDLPQEVVTDIDKDIRRTYPCYVQFGSAEGQEELRMVLRAYAAYDPEVGYCQGMNFVAGTILLFVRNPAEAFAALVLLMQERGLRKFYVRSMSLLQVQLWQLSKLMSPKLCQHLEMFGVVPMLYGASWLMTGFSADFPITFSARILDVMLTDKCHCALLKVAVAIMKRCERALRQMSDLEDIVKFLKVEVPKWDEYELDDILSDAFSKPWTPRQMSILNNTKDVETVAQGMERVMNLQEQASRAHGDDDDDEDHTAVPRSGGDDGSHSGGKGRGSAAMSAGVEFGAWTAVAGAPLSPTATNSFYPSTTCSNPLPGANSKSAAGSPDRAVTAATAATAATPTAAAGDADAASEGAAPCAAATAEEQQLAALQLAVAAAGQDICPAALQAALQATCWSASGGDSRRSGSMGGAFHPGSPHTPLVAKMELPRGTSVLQLAHAAAAVQAVLDAAAAEAASGTALAGATAGGVMEAAAPRGSEQTNAQVGASVVSLGAAKAPSLVSSLFAMDAVRLTPPSGWESHAGTDRTNSLSRGVSSELDHGTPTGALDTDPGQLQVVNHHD